MEKPCDERTGGTGGNAPEYVEQHSRAGIRWRGMGLERHESSLGRRLEWCTGWVCVHSEGAVKGDAEVRRSTGLRAHRSCSVAGAERAHG